MLRSIVTKCHAASLPITQGRYFHRSPVHFAVKPTVSSSISDAVKAEVKAENEDISTMDRCMKIIRKAFWVSSIPYFILIVAGEKADPAYHKYGLSHFV
jgi:hypothetical protein